MSFTNTMDESMTGLGLNPTAPVFVPKSQRKEKVKNLYNSVSSIVLSMEMDLDIPIGNFTVFDNSLTVYLSNETIMTFTPIDNDISHYRIMIQYCIVEGYDWKPYMNEAMVFKFTDEYPIDQAIAEFIYISSQSTSSEE